MGDSTMSNWNYSSAKVQALAAAALLTAISVGALSSSPPKAAPNNDTKAKQTFARDIAPIIQSKCASCHHPGEVAPFSLLSYEDVSKHAKQIAIVTKSKFMPPWKADSHGEFADERRLTDEQINTINAWSAAGSPMGDPKEMPPTPK